MFSKTCEYGIRATLFIADRSAHGERVGIKSISEAIESPEAFTAKILRQLVNAGIIISRKGPNGGFVIESHKFNTLNLKEIILAIDGKQLFEGCGLGLKECNAHKPCPMHSKFVSLRDDLDKLLKNALVRDLTTELAQGLTFLKR